MQEMLLYLDQISIKKSLATGKEVCVYELIYFLFFLFSFPVAFYCYPILLLSVLIFEPSDHFISHRYGYVAPEDVPLLLEQHIGKGEIVDWLWR